MDDLLRGFVEEGQELLDEIEPTILALQQATRAGAHGDPEEVNRLFRLFHTLKGSAGFLGLERVSQLTHQAESVLDQVRSGKRPLSGALIDLLCQAIDQLRQLLAAIVELGLDHGHDEEVQAVVNALRVEVIAGDHDHVPDELVADEAPLPQEPAVAGEEALTDAHRANSTADLVAQLGEDFRKRFVQEGEEQLEDLEQRLLAVSKDPGQPRERLSAAFRAIHSFKGSCGLMGLAELERLAHRAETVLDLLREGKVERLLRAVEDLLTIVDVLRSSLRGFALGGNGTVDGLDAFLDLLDEQIRSGRRSGSKVISSGFKPASAREVAPSDDGNAPTERRTASEVFRKTGGVMATEVQRQDVRVDLSKLDQLINMVGELMLAESVVANNRVVHNSDDEDLGRAMHHLRRVAGELQDIAMAVRMIPLAGTFRKMLRVVHDVAKRVGKQATLVVKGEETEVDKTVIEKIADPLVHMVRNAVDHGLEPAEERVQLGKPEQGTITLSARHEAGEVWILIADDGRGLNREKLLAKAREKGLIAPDEGEDWPDSQVYNIIFLPGFSTAAKLTDVSGRGVGMDVVKKNIEMLKGRVDIDSKLGQGTTIRLRLPLTLAIIDGMLVRVGKTCYILPILGVQEAFQPDPARIIIGPDGSEMVRVRDDIYPVIRLHQVLSQSSDHEQLADGLLVTIDLDGRRACLFVDEVLGQQETVIKGLSPYLGNARGVAGCTILGDGSVALILDLAGVLALHQQLAAHT